MASTTPATPRSMPDRQADGRDGRTVGDNDDSVLDSLGKAIVAPVEGADEDAAPEAGGDRPFADLTRPLPHGAAATDDTTLSTGRKAAR